MKTSVRTILIAMLALCAANVMAEEGKISEEEARAALADIKSACTQPSAPSVPSGASASTDEMAEAGSNVRTFVSGTQDFLKCLDDKEASYGEDITKAQKAVLTLVYNRAVEAMQTSANSFNSELKAYKAARADEASGDAKKDD